ncbi:unnamed protein product [Pleuronectes platessa]|uniref:Uncharacterized protein n=1 Tax=Pleuronectes platessa TaxID=8262 RepID=A0A9N7VJC5_PLEPL|nr:unnamed protein product [Pleuronectes platessa]
MLSKESDGPRRVCLNIKAVTSQHQSCDPAARQARPLRLSGDPASSVSRSLPRIPMAAKLDMPVTLWRRRKPQWLTREKSCRSGDLATRTDRGVCLEPRPVIKHLRAALGTACGVTPFSVIINRLVKSLHQIASLHAGCRVNVNTITANHSRTGAGILELDSLEEQLNPSSAMKSRGLSSPGPDVSTTTTRGPDSAASPPLPPSPLVCLPRHHLLRFAEWSKRFVSLFSPPSLLLESGLRHRDPTGRTAGDQEHHNGIKSIRLCEMSGDYLHRSARRSAATGSKLCALLTRP